MKCKLLENKILDNNKLYSLFRFSELSSGFGLTLGNSLRRILLTQLIGTAITKIKKNIYFDLFTIPNIKEPLDEVLTNLGSVVLKSSVLRFVNAQLRVTGPKIVCARDLILPQFIDIINPDQYLFSILDDSFLNLNIVIENGFGYKFSKNICTAEERYLDVKFSPIDKVNYKIVLDKNEKNITESLYFEIWTNGSITPKLALNETLKILILRFFELLL